MKAPAAEEKPDLPRVPFWLLSLGVLSAASFVALLLVVVVPSQNVTSLATVPNMLDNTALVFAFAACVYATTRTVADTRRMWILLSCGLFSWLIGETIYDIRVQLLDHSTAESIADVFYMAFYPLAIAGLWMRDRQARSGGLDARMLDALIVAGAVALIAYELVYDRNVGLAPTNFGEVVRRAYPVFDGLLIWEIIYQAYNPAIVWDPTRWLLAAGTVGLLVADIFWNVLGSVEYAVVISAAMICIGIAAAASPVLTRPRPSLDRHTTQLVPAIVLLLSAASVVGLVLIKLYDEMPAVIVGGAIVTALIVIRLLLTLAQNNRLLLESQRRSVSDPLTGLRNRQYFHDRLEVEIDRSKREGLPVGLLLIDIDNFKTINDLAGHRTGDRVLVAVADAMRAASRSTDVVCRTGGDELAIIAPGTGAEATMDMAERLRMNVHEITVPEVNAFERTSVSIGACVYPDLVQSEQDLMDRADETLYAVKQSGRDRAALYSPGSPAPRDAMWQLERAKAELTARDADFRAVFAHAHEAMAITDDAGLVLLVNDAAVRMFDAPRERMIGRNVLEFVKPDHQSELVKLMARTVESGEAVGRLHLQVPGNLHLLVEFSTSRFSPSRYLTIVRDVSDQERHNEELSASEARFRGVFENSIDAMFITDDSGIVRDANRAAALLTDRSLPELIGKSVEELVPATDAASVTEQREALRGLQTRVGNFTTRDGKGNLRTVEYSAVADFVPGLHLSIVRDVTDRIPTPKPDQ